MKLSLYSLVAMTLVSNISYAQQGTSNGNKNRDLLPPVKVARAQDNDPRTLDEAARCTAGQDRGSSKHYHSKLRECRR